ncbi:electron transport complex subunit E [Thiothrix subterranea]|uniref:Ion-translocating oxidoreductase complex subunit E n=1 Tax=Thiothrix subterranea TaxID=2735563 RepID=A0AA51MQ28_9GAMM|nr:electron transport complex subunit E [Thiothrix subterranea]MDQ5770014.1 electron transport complex subunit E [Thiothrix subterranea]WML88285.1 electron transport complex subunit E [Thiothrix subterranea]
MSDYRRIAKDGLWDNNVVFAQGLALCPVLAVTSSATNGLGMGLASTAVLVMSNLLVSLIRQWVSPAVRIPVYIVLIATLVTLVDMALNAWVHELYKVLGLFIALIVVNCAILGRAESFASKNSPIPAVFDGLMMGLGFTLALVILGGVREVLGSGTLFASASLLLGKAFSFMELTIIPDYKGFLLMILPPGGFMALGFLLAGKRVWDARMMRLSLQRGKGDRPVAPTEVGGAV